MKTATIGEKKVVPVCGTRERRNRIASQFLKGRKVRLFRLNSANPVPVPNSELMNDLRKTTFHVKKEDGHMMKLDGVDALMKGRGRDVFYKEKIREIRLLQFATLGYPSPEPRTRSDVLNEFFGDLYVEDEHMGKRSNRNIKYVRAHCR